MNRIAPTFAPLTDCGSTITRLRRPIHACDLSLSPEDRPYCQWPTAVPPHIGLAHSSAIAAHLFVSQNDTGCLLYAPIIAPGGAA